MIFVGQLKIKETKIFHMPGIKTKPWAETGKAETRSKHESPPPQHQHLKRHTAFQTVRVSVSIPHRYILQQLKTSIKKQNLKARKFKI